MSLNLFSGLMPAEEAFTPLFCEQAQRILQAAEELRQMIAEDIAAEQHVATIREIEMAADAVARRIFIGANRTFTAQLWFGPTEACSQVSVVLMKSSVSEPTNLTLLTFSAISPAVFDTTTACGWPIVLTGWLPKVSAAGAGLNTGAAVFSRTDAPPGLANFAVARSAACRFA